MRNQGLKVSRKYSSYSDRKNHQYLARKIVLFILFSFLVHTLFTSLIFTMWSPENDAMAPNLRSGERIIFSSYTIHHLIPALNLEQRPLPLRRGSIVLVDMYKGGNPGILYYILDGGIRFFTAQRVNIADRNGQKPEDYRFVKRVIGLPGDEITITEFTARVKVKGSNYNLTEFEVTEYDYTLEIPQMPAIWDSYLPFSGNMDSIVLGENEYFVLSDDRSNTNDSRTWGPVQQKNISGKALYRYWPFTRLGRP